MSELNMTIQSGVTRVLHTAGKYCDKDIVIKAEGGDYGKGYESGYGEGHEKGYADGYGLGKDEGFANGYEEGMTDGKAEQYDAFWDMFQQKGSRRDYQYAFTRVWTDALYNPQYPIVCGNEHVYTATAIFGESKITDTKVPITVIETRADTMFQHCSNLIRIPSITFTDVIRFSNTFRNCKALEEINVQGEIGMGISFVDSPLLTTASVNSIIAALKDLTGATAQTVTFHADVGSKLTDEQKATITAKNWTLVY